MNRISVILSSLVFAACGAQVSDIQKDPNGNPDPNNPNNPNPTPVEPETCTEMDLVFVIDDSGSMAEEQENLANNFGQFADLLSNYRTKEGNPVDFRIAITTTGRDVDYTLTQPIFPPISMSEPGENGAFTRDCGVTNGYIESSDPQLKTKLQCVANVGTTGPSYEMPLLVTELAFTERIADGTNAGFVRDSALLATIYLTDEDDCSRPDNNFNIGITDDPCTANEIVAVSEYVAFMDDFKGRRERWASAIIAGETDCSSSFGDAVEATRLKEFAVQSGDNVVFSSICEGNLTNPLQEALDTFEAACERFVPID